MLDIGDFLISHLHIVTELLALYLFVQVFMFLGNHLHVGIVGQIRFAWLLLLFLLLQPIVALVLFLELFNPVFEGSLGSGHSLGPLLVNQSCLSFWVGSLFLVLLHRFCYFIYNLFFKFSHLGVDLFAFGCCGCCWPLFSGLSVWFIGWYFLCLLVVFALGFIRWFWNFFLLFRPWWCLFFIFLVVSDPCGFKSSYWSQIPLPQLFQHFWDDLQYLVDVFHSNFFIFCDNCLIPFQKRLLDYPNNFPPTLDILHILRTILYSLKWSPPPDIIRQKLVETRYHKIDIQQPLRDGHVKSNGQIMHKFIDLLLLNLHLPVSF